MKVGKKVEYSLISYFGDFWTRYGIMLAIYSVFHFNIILEKDGPILCQFKIVDILIWIYIIILKFMVFN